MEEGTVEHQFDDNTFQNNVPVGEPHKYTLTASAMLMDALTQAVQFYGPVFNVLFDEAPETAFTLTVRLNRRHTRIQIGCGPKIQNTREN